MAILYKRLAFSFDPARTDRDGLDRYYQALAGDAREVEAALRAITSRVVIAEGDISREEDILRTFELVEATLGPVDILVNNAGMYAEKDTIFTLNEEGYRVTYDAEVKGTLFMTQQYVRRYLARHGLAHNDLPFKQRLMNREASVPAGKASGRVINLSTDSAQVFAGQIAYGSSKAAVEALTRAVALEVAHLGITVNAVAPGPIQTGWLDEEHVEAVLPSIPLGRIGMPQDIADTILFLASDKASWITGQVIRVCGGHVM